MTEKIIEIENLSYVYPDGIKALNNISFSVKMGESLGVIGPNGAGKSTLLLHLNGVLKQNSGRVRICGIELNQKNIFEVRKKVGVVFQDPDTQLFMPTVFDDVAFGPINLGFSNKEVKESVNSALSKVDMSNTENRISHHLSFGEKKRICLATVISMDPDILVLDEPSSNLDPRHRRELMSLLKASTLTRIIATHDLDLVLELCSRVIVLNKGNLVAQGDSNVLLRDKGLLELYGLELPLTVKER